MYTGVNDIMRLDRGPRSSLGDTLLAVSLKALTTDPPSAELMTPTAGYEPLYMIQAARTALLVIMSTLDDVDIAPVQRGDQSRGVVIPGPGGPGGVSSGHDHGGVPAGGVPASSRSGASAGGRGGATGGSSAAALGKGKRSSLMTMRYRPTRTSLCRSGCGNSPASGWRCAMRRPWLTRRPWTSGLRRRQR
jgi:hypothetical protein